VVVHGSVGGGTGAVGTLENQVIVGGVAAGEALDEAFDEFGVGGGAGPGPEVVHAGCVHERVLLHIRLVAAVLLPDGESLEDEDRGFLLTLGVAVVVVLLVAVIALLRRVVVPLDDSVAAAGDDVVVAQPVSGWQESSVHQSPSSQSVRDW